MLVHVKVLASVTGQIICLQSVLGNKVRLRTRELFNCINAMIKYCRINKKHEKST